MLIPIFEKLEAWLELEIKTARADGTLPLSGCEFRIVGQTALLEANLQLHLAATVDVDVISTAHYAVHAHLGELLQEIGLELDPLSDEIWMPTETRYVALYQGTWVKAWLAEPTFVLISKALKAPYKNKVLIREYLAGAPTKEFFLLCKRYGIDLTRFIQD